MLHSCPLTAEKFAAEFDEFGDNFTEDITEEQLKETFEAIDNKVSFQLT